MSSFQKTWTNFAFVAMMILAILAMIVTTQSNNHATQPIIENDLFNGTYFSLNSTLLGLEDTSNTQYDSFTSETPAPGFGSIVMFTIVSVGKTFGTLLFSIFSIIVKIPLIILGIDPTITAVLVSFVTITIIISLWLVYKFGG